MKRTLIITAVIAVFVLISVPAYRMAQIVFGPWEVFPHVIARAKSPNGKLRAEIYRKGFQHSWYAYYRVTDEDGLVVDQRFAGFDTIGEPELYLSEARIDGDTLVVGPYAGRDIEKQEYYRIPIHPTWSRGSIEQPKISTAP